MKKIQRLFLDFLKFKKSRYLKEIKFWQIKNFPIKKEEAEKNFRNFELESFFSFLQDLKVIFYSKDPLKICLDKSRDQWEFLWYFTFLKKRNLIDFKKRKIIPLQKWLLDYFPRPKNYSEIKKILERKLKVELKEDLPSNFLFKLKPKGHFDQLPVSVSSAIFIVEKILEYLPLYKKFLFVGDDDFLSVYLSLAEPRMEISVVDIDDETLKAIDNFSKKFNLKIETKKINIEKEKNLKEKFIGFFTAPPNTFDGVKTFLDFGLRNLSKDGGGVFLSTGDEGMGHTVLFLEKFFAQKNLEIKEVVPKKIYYPFSEDIKEYQYLLKKMGKFFEEKSIKKAPVLGSSLWIFEYFPLKIKKMEKKPLYFYY
jgi:hypothetical protein